MTYGENCGQLREALGALLHLHRIQRRIGGAGIHTVETTIRADRNQIGQQIRRYRQGILIWCHEAVTAASPKLDLAGATSGSRGPAEELRYRLHQAITHSEAPLASMEELVTRQHFALVDTWRRAARAAALGEQDFSAGITRGNLDDNQCLTVIVDAAEITRALVLLDQRYQRIPGWQRLAQPLKLDRAAATYATHAPHARHDHRDVTVDHLGWRPTAGLITGPARAGIAGVVQAEHNLLIHLDTPLTALNLKRILDSQRDLSHQLAARVAAADPTRAARWQTRARGYARVFAATRNLGGLVGGGADAATEGAFAVSRLRHLPPDTPLDPRAQRDLERLFDLIDARLLARIDQGVHQRLYFVKASLPRIDDRDGNVTHRPAERFTPATTPVQTDLLGLVREHLHPPSAPRRLPPACSRDGRLDFDSASTHLRASDGVGL